MPDPANYVGAFANTPDPMQQFAQGLQLGNAMRQTQLQQQQQALALAQQQQMQADLGALASKPSPTAQDYAAIITRYPQLSEHFKRGWDILNADQQQNSLRMATQAYAALQSGRNDVAAQLLRNQAAAMRNGGDQQHAQATEDMAHLIELSPETAKTTGALMLSSIMGPDKFESTFAGLGKEQRDQQLQPAAVTKANAEASKAGSEAVTAAVAAGNAPTATELGNQKTAVEIQSAQLKQDLDRIDAQIKVANSETERGKLQLERDKVNTQLQQLKQSQGFQAQDAMDAVSQALNTVKRIRQSPGLSSIGTATGKLAALIPGTDSKDVRALVDTLKNEQFMTQLQQLKETSANGSAGMGALSNAEGARLENAVASLDTDQSVEQFKTSLATIEQLMMKAQSKLVSRGRLPTSGEAFVMKHPVYGNVTEGQINALMRQFPGSTRAQVLTFLQQTGGK
jgi:hypothetical protein